MRRKAVLFLLLVLGWLSPATAAPQQLKISDIHRVLERLFSFHIEMKELNPTVVRRAMKIYIEQFDPDRAYLLESEVAPFLNLSDKRAGEIMARLKIQDYSDFFALNEIFQQAILRSQAIRGFLKQQLIERAVLSEFSSGAAARYASSEARLVERQEMRISRFFLFHKARANIDTRESRVKICALYERKMRRLESAFLWQDSLGQSFSQEKINHFLSTKILKSFAKSLDTHTSFFSPEEAYEMRLSLEKQFEGVGVILSEGIDGVMISEVVKGSPAEQSGKIQVNDLLVAIDGSPLESLSFEEVLDLLKKKEKGDISFGFKRVDVADLEPSFFQVTLKKQPISMNEERLQVSTEKFGDGIIGKISLYSFYENGDGISSERDIKEAIRSFREQGELHGLVLDLRENSGGFLSQAVKVSSLFMGNGVVVMSKYGKGDVHFLRSLSVRPLFNGPIVILTSKMSASAAEIVAQALQDYGVGIVVGDERTFGKGSIQFQTVTDEKADLFFKITVGRYYTVSGRSTQINGVIADIVVPTQYAPYNIGEKFLEYPLAQDSVAPAYVDQLSDLDEKTQKLFQKHYLPFAQRVVPYWKRILPQLKQNSAARLFRNPDFKAFLRRLDKISARQNSLPVNTVDEHFQIGLEDLQMIESVNILKDMIYIEAQDH